MGKDILLVTLQEILYSKDPIKLIHFVSHYPIESKTYLDTVEFGVRSKMVHMLEKNFFLKSVFAINPDEFISQMPHIMHKTLTEKEFSCFSFGGKTMHQKVDYYTRNEGLVQVKVYKNFLFSYLEKDLKLYSGVVNHLGIIMDDVRTPSESGVDVRMEKKQLTWKVTAFSDCVKPDLENIESLQNWFFENEKPFFEAKNLLRPYLQIHKQIILGQERLNALSVDSEAFFRLQKAQSSLEVQFEQETFRIQKYYKKLDLAIRNK
jgi:hypothetical protein